MSKVNVESVVAGIERLENSKEIKTAIDTLVWFLKYGDDVNNTTEMSETVKHLKRAAANLPGLK